MTQDSAPPPPIPPPPPYPAYADPQPPRKPAWFWIAIAAGCSLILLTVLLIVAAIAVPQVLKIKKHANQTAAIQTMRTIAQAEANYNLISSPRSYACSLAALAGTDSAQSSELIDATLATSGQKSGYVFAITCPTKTTVDAQNVSATYQLTAVPTKVGQTGDSGFCADENNVMRVDPTGGTNCTEPLE